MDDNVYKAPQADLGKVNIDVPPEIANKIRSGWIAATVSAAMTLIMVFVAQNTAEFGEIWNVSSLIDVALIAILAIGIYFKSRTTATLMFIYFLLSKIYIVVVTHQVSGLVLGLIFLYFYLQAMIGTYQYHKLMKEFENLPPNDAVI